jgi:hypothetical protein
MGYGPMALSFPLPCSLSPSAHHDSLFFQPPNGHSSEHSVSYLIRLSHSVIIIIEHVDIAHHRDRAPDKREDLAVSIAHTHTRTNRLQEIDVE